MTQRVSALRRVVVRGAGVALMAALSLLPRTSVMAYSGQQYYTAEDGCCVAKSGSFTFVNSWNGYDYSWYYASGGNVNHFWWYPKTSGAWILCPVIHIANDASKSFAQVYYNHYDGNSWVDNYYVYQQYNAGYWLSWKNGTTYDLWQTNSNIYLYDIMSSQEIFSMDDIAWHYNSSSNYTTCSYT